MDDNLLYGRPLGRVYPNPGTPRPSYKEIAEYRRSHLSSRILRAVDKLLSGRRTAEVDSNDDIIVSRYDAPWSWQHDEIDLRSKCFELLEVADVKWAPYRPGDPAEGWLMVEDNRIVGAAEFKQRGAFCWLPGHSQEPAIRAWVWVWVFVDPEHRRKGVVSRRLPIWEERYGEFVIDQPNPNAMAMLRKLGCLARHGVSGPSRNGISMCLPGFVFDQNPPLGSHDQQPA